MDNPARWAADVANSWRTTQDISDAWGSVIHISELNGRKWRYAKPHAFNDPDMLEVGNGGMTNIEYRSHFSLWSIMKSPLLIGCDLRTIDDETLAILTNKEVIAVNQDSLGVQGRRVWSDRKGEQKKRERESLLLMMMSSSFSLVHTYIGIVAPPAIVIPCDLGDEQGGGGSLSWTHDGSEGGLLHVGGNRCLTVASGNFSDTAPITVETCGEGERNQQWVVDGMMIQAKAAPDLCLR